jgi:hypothetical protein
MDLEQAKTFLGRPDLVLPDPVPEHPLLSGLSELGRGEYSIVLAAPDPERVFKVVSSPADHFFLTAEDRPKGLHFPTVFADHGRVGRALSGFPFYLIEMERLWPLLPQSPAAHWAQIMTEAYWKACERWSRLGSEMGRTALYHLTREQNEGWPPDLVEALNALLAFVEAYQIQPDILVSNNLMVRKDGCLVFSDPVFIA